MDSYVLISLIANIVLMGFLLAFMYSLYMRDKQYDRDRRAVHSEATRSIEDAHKRAASIIEHAVERAKDTLLKTEYIREDVMKNLESNLNDVSEATVKLMRDEALTFNKEYKTMLESIQIEHARMLEEARQALQDVEYVKETLREDMKTQMQKVLSEAQAKLSEETNVFDQEYREMLETTKKEYLHKSEMVLKTLEKIPEDEMREFQAVLKQETVSAQQLLGNRITDLFTEAEKEVAAYKAARMREVEASLQGITAKVLEDVLGKRLSKADQESLVLQSLDALRMDTKSTPSKAVEKPKSE